MSSVLSLPIVCYLGNLIAPSDKKKGIHGYLDIWVSIIYAVSGEYLGHRIVSNENGLIQTETFGRDNENITTEQLNQIDSEFIISRITSASSDKSFTNFYQIIDSFIIECITSEASLGVICSETLSTEPRHNSRQWKDVLFQTSWFCHIWDPDRNQVGSREIYVADDWARIDTELSDHEKSTFEIIRRLPVDFGKQFGSYKNYIARCQTIDLGMDKKVSSGGIILDTNGEMDRHRKIAAKLNVKNL
jgi:hypothetical protein